VWITDDVYALTIKNDNEKQKHIFFKVMLQLKKLPETCGNYTWHLSESWEAWAMVDTGATVSAVTGRMVERMGLESQGDTEITHAMGKAKSRLYVFDVIFPGDKEFENIEAVELSDDHNCDFLIGMDILSQGDTAITSVNGKLAFSFLSPPRERYIDFELYN
jgi:predicted aspartyl protease